MNPIETTRIVIVKNPEKKTTYYCAECDFSSTGLKTLQNHKQVSGHLSKGKTDIIKYFGETEKQKAIEDLELGQTKAVFEEDANSFVEIDKEENVTKSQIDNEGRKIFKCNTCDKSYKSSIALHIHNRNIHEVQPINCTQCSKKFTPKNLYAHMRQVHPAEKHSCTECDYVGKTKLSINLHFNAKHSNKKYMCGSCGKTFGHPFSLRKHIKQKHEENLIFCESCDFRTDDPQSMDCHRDALHGVRNVSYFCPYCEYETLSGDLIESHKMEEHEDEENKKINSRKPEIRENKVFECDECGHKGTSKKGIYLHKRVKHQNIKHKCNFCEFETTQKAGVKNHTESIHMNIKQKCEFCDYEAPGKPALRRHRFKQHGDEVKMFACSKCSYRTQFKYLMSRHLLSKDRKHR